MLRLQNFLEILLPGKKKGLSTEFNLVANPCAPSGQIELWNDAAFVSRAGGNNRPPVFTYRTLFGKDQDIALSIVNRRLAPGETPSIVKILGSINKCLELPPKDLAQKIGISEDRALAFKRNYLSGFQSIQWKTNCYAHAANLASPDDLPGTMLQPGELSGPDILSRYPDTKKSYVRDFLEFVERDGGRYAGEKLPGILKETYRVAAYVVWEATFREKTVSDYHFARENRDGSTSHKSGLSIAEKLRGFPQRLPYGDNGLLYERIGFFLFPEGGLSPRTPS